MREILFRGRNENSTWIYGSLLVDKDTFDKNAFIYYICDIDGYSTEIVNTKTIGQFTGLNDKNGTKIFENGYMIIDNKTYKVIFDNAEYILTNIFNCDIITLKNNSIKGVFVDEI